MELVTPAGAVHTSRRHHTMPVSGTPLGYYNANHQFFAPLPPNTLKRSATAKEIRMAKKQLQINNILSQYEQRAFSTSPNTDGWLADANSSEKSHSIGGITGEDWPVPTLFLEQPIDGSTHDHGGALTLGGSGNPKIPYMDNSQGYLAVEDLNLVPHFNELPSFAQTKTGFPYPAPTSDSGVGGSVISNTWHSPKSASHYGAPTTSSYQKERGSECLLSMWYIW